MSLRDTDWILNAGDTANPVKYSNSTMEQLSQAQNTVQVRSGSYNITYSQRVTTGTYKWHGLSESAALNFINNRNADGNDSRDYQVTRQSDVIKAYAITTTQKFLGPFVFDTITLDT